MNTLKSVTAIVFEDKKDGGYCAFIKEIPGIVAQGNTFEEVKQDLTFALNVVVQDIQDNKDDFKLPDNFPYELSNPITQKINIPVAV